MSDLAGLIAIPDGFEIHASDARRLLSNNAIQIGSMFVPSLACMASNSRYAAKRPYWTNRVPAAVDLTDAEIHKNLPGCFGETLEAVSSFFSRTYGRAKDE